MQAKPKVHGCKYSKKEVLELKAIFSQHDKNNDGEVSTKELAESLSTSKAFPGKGHDAFRLLDKNRDGKITFDEYLCFCFPLATAQERKTMTLWAFPPKQKEVEKKIVLTREQENELKAMFNSYDPKKTGILDQEAFVQAVMKCGFDKSEGEKLFKETDKDNSGGLAFEEFMQLMAPLYAPDDEDE